MPRTPDQLLRIDCDGVDGLAEFYVYPRLTWEEGTAVLEGIDASGQFRMGHVPDLLVKLARDANGKRLWAERDRQQLREWDLTAMARVLHQLTPVFESVAEAMKKND